MPASAAFPRADHGGRAKRRGGSTAMQSTLLVGRDFGMPTPASSAWKPGELQLSNWSVQERVNGTTPGELDALDSRRAQYGQFSQAASVFLAVLMTLLVFATVVGNALVILAFVVEKSLRTQGNFFFLNLAIADFLVGELSNVSCFQKLWLFHCRKLYLNKLMCSLTLTVNITRHFCIRKATLPSDITS